MSFKHRCPRCGAWAYILAHVAALHYAKYHCIRCGVVHEMEVPHEHHH